MRLHKLSPILWFLFLIVAFFSCKNEKKTVYITEDNTPSYGTSLAKKNTLLPTSGVVASPAPSGMNPAHGQPGHRCDIPVGQPLNAPATQNNPKPIATTTTDGQKKITIDPKTTASAPPPGVSLNPAHGKPGHRCDLPVGQPLNAKPLPVKNQPNGMPANAENTSITHISSKVDPTAPKPKLNPAHGQPYHVCSKKVGEPL